MRGKRIWFKPTSIWQLKHNGSTGFVWRDFLNGHSLGMGLPANEVELIANWTVTYKTFWQTIAFKLRKLFA